MIHVLIQLPPPFKATVDALRTKGTTDSGLIRHLFEDYFNRSEVP